MKKTLWLWLLPLLTGCDPARMYENYNNFTGQCWPANEKPSFSFIITDTTTAYNLYANLRHDNRYAFANLYFTFTLSDSANVLHRQLLTADLYDRKSGRPLGSSGLGYIFNHRIALLRQYRFKAPGTYSLQLEHFMRTDTLCGIRSVGLRIERFKSP